MLSIYNIVSCQSSSSKHYLIQMMDFGLDYGQLYFPSWTAKDYQE